MSTRGRLLLVGTSRYPGVREAIIQAGFAVETVEGTRGAIDRVGADCPDGIVAAVDLPDGTGAELCSAIRERDRELPVVLVGEDDLAAIAADLFTADVTDYVRRKSGYRDTLVDTIVEGTERLERLRDRRHDQEMFDSLLENIPLSIYFKDRQSRHERVSDYMTHNNPDEYIKNPEGKVHPHAADVIGKTDFDLYEGGFAEAAVEDDRTVIEEATPIRNRIEASTTGSGERMFTATTKAPRYDADGNVIGLVGVTIDVTDRVRYRRELERHNERLEEFAEVLTHDLRNPVNVAQGYIDLLRGEYDPEAVAACDESLERIRTLIDEIREFVLQGRTVDSTESVDLPSVAERAWETVDTGDAELVVETDRRIRGDADRLQRLFENLFRNAVVHGTAESDDPLTVRLEWTGAGFAVADDGQGLPETDIETLFERGYTTETDGTGFGLAIIRDIAEAHGWSIAAMTDSDGGARFEFTGVVLDEDGIGETYGS